MFSRKTQANSLITKILVSCSQSVNMCPGLDYPCGLFAASLDALGNKLRHGWDLKLRRGSGHGYREGVERL